MYLLDTNVISEFRRPRPHGAVLAWLNSIPGGQIKISAMSVGEICTGIELTRDQDPAKAGEIEVWLETMLVDYEVLALDAPIMRLWARLMHNQSDDLYEDALIAATALVQGLTIVTRNTRDFNGFGTEVLNPFVRQR